MKEEAENDVALKVEGVDQKMDNADITVKGRGDLHLGILLEKMRREGFEMSVTSPIVLYREDPKTKKLLEPIEKVSIKIHPKYINSTIEILSNRGAIY